MFPFWEVTNLGIGKISLKKYKYLQVCGSNNITLHKTYNEFCLPYNTCMPMKMNVILPASLVAMIKWIK